MSMDSSRAEDSAGRRSFRCLWRRCRSSPRRSPTAASPGLAGGPAFTQTLPTSCSGADAIVSSNTFPSIPLIDPETLEFEINVDGFVSSGGLGGPAILPLSLAKMSQLTKAFPDRSFSGIGGVSDFNQALSYFLLGCGTVQVCTAAMLDQAVGPNVIKKLLAGLDRFLEEHAKDGFKNVEDFRGIRRDRIVLQSEIRRPDSADYHSGYETVEGYAAPQPETTVRV